MTKADKILNKHLSEIEAKYIADKRFLYESLIDAINEALDISSVSNCGDKHLSNICDKEGHQMSELWYVNEDRIPFQLEHSDKCCICGYENNSI